MPRVFNYTERLDVRVAHSFEATLGQLLHSAFKGVWTLLPLECMPEAIDSNITWIQATRGRDTLSEKNIWNLPWREDLRSTIVEKGYEICYEKNKIWNLPWWEDPRSAIVEKGHETYHSGRKIWSMPWREDLRFTMTKKGYEICHNKKKIRSSP